MVCDLETTETTKIKLKCSDAILKPKSDKDNALTYYISIILYLII